MCQVREVICAFMSSRCSEVGQNVTESWRIWVAEEGLGLRDTATAAIPTPAVPPLWPLTH